MTNGSVYAIIDRVANQIAGGLMMHRHAAPAIRMFSDVATMKGSIVAQHPEDFDLVQLAHITEDNQLEPAYEIVLSGSAWLAAQQQQEPQLVKEA